MDAVEEIKSRLDVVDAIQEYLQLKPAGSGSFKGLCPFHQEKSPSFFANRPRQSWHCFGCDQGGDVISFVMRMEGMEFREALELLAQKTGVELPAFDAKKSSQKKRLFEINDLASRWFRAVLLNDPRAEHARAYAAKRNIDDLTGDVWRIGYAPNEWRSLGTALKEKGVSEEELILAGLAVKRDSNTELQSSYDRFRDRLMFTICDVHGNIVGFTGRILNDNAKESKYVNTPETHVYKKSAILFGLNQAKGEIKRRDLAVVVEGNMDVIASHQHNVTHVVASSGTALTGEQLSLLKRFTKNVAFAFDQDSAGNAATIRGLDLARSLDFNIRIITIPPDIGKDPDDAIRKNVSHWTDAISHAAGIIDWLYQNAFKGRDASRPEEKKLIAKDILPEIRRISDSVERDGWIMKLANDLAVSPDALRDAIKTMPNMPTSDVGNTRRPTSEVPAVVLKSREDHLRERILALLHLRPELTALAESLLPGYPLAQEQTSDFLNYLAILADREFEDQSASTLEQELRASIASLREGIRGREGQDLEQQMRDAERTGDTARIQELLARFSSLNS